MHMMPRRHKKLTKPALLAEVLAVLVPTGTATASGAATVQGAGGVVLSAIRTAEFGTVLIEANNSHADPTWAGAPVYEVSSTPGHEQGTLYE